MQDFEQKITSDKTI